MANTDLRSYIVSNFDSLGLPAYNLAKQAGLSTQQILDLAAQQGLSYAPNTQNQITQDVTSGYNQQIGNLGQRLDQQARSFAGMQDQFRSQLSEQQAMFQKQQAEFANISRADVPNAEKSAAAEQRRELGQPTKRTSGLASLAIVSGLGTQANPLSGLQLA
jgi:hypothetical protein